MRSTTLNRLSLWEDNSLLSYIAARAQRTMLSPSPFTLLSCNTNTNQDADSLTRSILAEDYYVADTPATYRVLKHYRCRQQSREQRAVYSLCWRCLPLSSIQTQQKSILSFCVLNIQQSFRLWHYGKDHEGKLDDSNNEADEKSSPRSEQLLHISQSRFGMVFLQKKTKTKTFKWMEDTSLLRSARDHCVQKRRFLLLQSLCPHRYLKSVCLTTAVGCVYIYANVRRGHSKTSVVT